MDRPHREPGPSPLGARGTGRLETVPPAAVIVLWLLLEVVAVPVSLAGRRPRDGQRAAIDHAFRLAGLGAAVLAWGVLACGWDVARHAARSIVS